MNTIGISLLTIFLFTLPAYASKISNEMIYQKLLELEKRQAIMEVEFRLFREQVDKRFEELREDMNKRFELIDKRFEEVDKRFEEQLTFLEIVAIAFSTIAAATIGFAIWDRKTVISRAKEETLQELKTDERMKEFINALKNLAERDKDVAKLLKQFHLL